MNFFKYKIQWKFQQHNVKTCIDLLQYSVTATTATCSVVTVIQEDSERIAI
jgi:hypothetical protein